MWVQVLFTPYYDPIERALLLGNCRQILDNQLFIKLLSITLTNFVLMGYRGGTLIWNGLMLTNSSFFKCWTEIVSIMFGSWSFQSAEFYLIRAGNKKWYTFCYLYMLWKVHIFLGLGETQSGMRNSLSASQYSI